MYSNTKLVSLFLLSFHSCGGCLTDGAAAIEDYSSLYQRLSSNERITKESIRCIDAFQASEKRAHEMVSTFEARNLEYLKRLSDLELHDSKLDGIIGELKTQMSNIQTRLEATELRESALVEQVMQLENKNKEQSTLVYHLQKQILQQSRQMASILKHSKLTSLHLKEHSKTVDGDNHVKHLDVGEKIISKARSKRLSRILPSEQDLPVAFFATMNASMSHVGTNQTIIFDGPVINVGNAYNKHLGAFIAPVAGIYVFSATIKTHTATYFDAAFIHNNQRKSYIALDGALTNSYATGSMTIVLQLQKGDVVSLHCINSNIDIEGGRYSTFAGFLLHADNPSLPIVG